MNVEIGTEAPIFLFWDYLFQILGILSLQCRSKEYSVHRKLRFKRFKGLVASATFFVYFLYYFVQYIHSFIHPFAEGQLLFPYCSSLSRGPPWGAEPGFELGPTRTVDIVRRASPL
jgi:hypothetical protein